MSSFKICFFWKRWCLLLKWTFSYSVVYLFKKTLMCTRMITVNDHCRHKSHWNIILAYCFLRNWQQRSFQASLDEKTATIKYLMLKCNQTLHPWIEQQEHLQFIPMDNSSGTFNWKCVLRNNCIGWYRDLQLQPFRRCPNVDHAPFCFIQVIHHSHHNFWPVTLSRFLPGLKYNLEIMLILLVILF